MKRNVTQKLIESRLDDGSLEPGSPIALRVDQTLSQDATGALVMLEFEAMEIPRVKTELSAQYVDHNLLQEDFRNPDDHLFLQSACRKYGVQFSPPGNGVSHPVIERGSNIQPLPDFDSSKREVSVKNKDSGASLSVAHSLDEREWKIVSAGGMANWIRSQRDAN